MSIEITVRHGNIPKDMQEYAQAKAVNVVDSFPMVEYLHVIIDFEKHLSVVEVVVQAKNHIRVDASESSSQLRASIDKAFDKTERQLRKHRDKVQSKRKHKAAKTEIIEVDTGGSIEDR